MGNRYDKYKDSGIAWIGEIPEHWEIKSIKTIFVESKETCNGENSILLSLSQYTGIKPKIETDLATSHIAESYEGYKLVKKGQFVMNIMLAWNGSYAVSDYDGIISPAYCVFDFRRKVKEKYFHYLLRTSGYSEAFRTRSKGIIDSRLRLYPESFYKFDTIIPSLSEQQSIAAYLDQKCGEIDELITLQEEMITKLQSYKQSVITEAVTKGLDKNVPLKDSGIEWIGEIPEHWKVIKIKNAFNIISGATPKTDNMAYWDGEITWITPADYNTEDKMISSGKRNITLAGLNSCGTSIVPEGSIIFSKRAPIGLVAINVVPLCTNQGCISCIPKPSVNTKYFYYLMSVLTDWFELFGSGTTFKELSTNNFANFILSQPPFSEQQAIADYLDQRCSEIDELISIKQQKIEKLKEYKKSLIFECVTGKRKVS